MARYRIVRDGYLGYEAQKKVWGLFWKQMPSRSGTYVNTHRTVEEAEKFIRNQDEVVKEFCL